MKRGAGGPGQSPAGRHGDPVPVALGRPRVSSPGSTLPSAAFLFAPRPPGRPPPPPDPGGATRPPTRGPRRGSSPGGGRPGREGPMKFSAAFPACPGGRPVPGGGHRNPSTAGSRRGAPRASVVRAPRPRDRRTWPPRVSAHKGGSHRERGPSRGMCPKKAVSEAAQTDGGDK